MLLCILSLSINSTRAEGTLYTAPDYEVDEDEDDEENDNGVDEDEDDEENDYGDDEEENDNGVD